MCANTSTFLSQGTPTHLLGGTYGEGTVSFTDIGTATTTYNAMGFDTANNYLYAIDRNSTDALLQIDSTGTVTSLGAVTNLPEGLYYYIGAFDDSGNLWVSTGNAKAYKVDVSSTPPTATPIALTASWTPNDWTFLDGDMWGLSGTTLYRANVSTGSVNTYPAPVGVTSGVYGADWTFGNGNLGFARNSDGKIYQIAVMNPTSSPTFTLVSQYTGPTTSGENDGAQCVSSVVSATTDLGIVKAGPATVAPSGSVDWTLTVANNGPGSSSGFAVSDDVPPAVTHVTSSTPGCAVSGNDVNCGEGGLGDGHSFVIDVAGTAPSTARSCIVNTATVTANEVDPNSTNNSSTFETCNYCPGGFAILTPSLPNAKVGAKYSNTVTACGGTPPYEI